MKNKDEDSKIFFFNIITITFAGVHLLGGLSREGFIFILKNYGCTYHKWSE